MEAANEKSPPGVTAGQGIDDKPGGLLSTHNYRLLPNKCQVKKGIAGDTATPPTSTRNTQKLMAYEDYSINASEAIEQLETWMAEADSIGDLDAWLEAYFQWLDLWPQVHLGGVQHEFITP